MKRVKHSIPLASPHVKHGCVAPSSGRSETYKQRDLGSGRFSEVMLINSPDKNRVMKAHTVKLFTASLLGHIWQML